MTDVMVAGIVLIVCTFLTYGYLLAKAYIKVKNPQEPYRLMNNIPLWTSSTKYYPKEKEETDEPVVSEKSLFQNN